jgi:hypothetical protein
MVRNAKMSQDEIEYSLFNGVGIDGQGEYTNETVSCGDILGKI